MDIYDDPTYINGAKFKEFSKGKLLQSTKGAIIENEFRYSVRRARAFQSQTSLMPGFEFVTPEETIFTSRLDLPFAKDKSVVLQDGRTMTIVSATYEYDSIKAYFSGDGRTGWLITLTGGQPND